MNDDFEQRLRHTFADERRPVGQRRFDAEVREGSRAASRAANRRWRRWRAATVSPSLFSSHRYSAPARRSIAAAPATLNSALGALLVSPVGYALGALTVVAALVDMFSDSPSYNSCAAAASTQHVVDCADQPLEILRADHERRHQIDDVAERPHPNAVPTNRARSASSFGARVSCTTPIAP